MRVLAAIALVACFGAAAYCCGPKAKPPVAAVCPGGQPETCLHDNIGDYDCTCPE